MINGPLDMDSEIELFNMHARKNQDYFAYERTIEIFENSIYTKFGLLSGVPWYILADSYLNIGDDVKAAMALMKWEEYDVKDFTMGERFVISLGLKLNKIAKVRENPPRKAFETIQTFRDILMESSQGIHLKMAASSPVMDTIEQYVKLSCVEEMQDECVSDMLYSLKDRKGVFLAFYCIVTGTDLYSIIKSSKSKICESVWSSGSFYFPKHPEFPFVYKRYERLYEVLYF